VLRVRTAVLVASFVIAYFVGLTYAVLRAGTYAGLEDYLFLTLAAVIFGIFAVRDRARLGSSFLIFFNASRMFVLSAMAAFLLSEFGIVRIPVDNVTLFGVWGFPFGLYLMLNFVYLLGFSERKTRYYFFPWVRDGRQTGGQ